MGNDFSKGVDSAVSIITGIITGDMTGGLAGASAPWLAEQIKIQAGDNETARLVAHAILGAVVAELQGNSALSGGVGAVAGEVAADIIRKQLYGKEVKDLTEEEKQTISALSQLASGLAVAAGGGNFGDASAAISSSKNAVENNYLSASEDKKRKDAQAELELIKKGLLNASDERKQELEDLITALNALDDYKNQVLIIACQNIKSTECSVARAELDKAYQSYFDSLSPEDRIAYNDAYANYTKYYNGYKDIESLQFGLDVANVEKDRDILAQRISENWGVDKATADKIVLGMRINSDLAAIAGIVVGHKLNAAELSKLENTINKGGQTLAQPKLPTGYSKQGDNIVGPRGGVYTNTGQVDAAGNAVYSNNGSYYTFENGVKTKTTSPNTNTGSQVQQNYQNGKDYEQAKYEKFKETQVESAREVTLVTDEGTKIRLDMIGRDQQGNISCAECKSSQTAPLTENQKVGFPELEKSGGVIVGEGKPGFEGGTIIPPTKVEIIRPNE